MQRVLLATGVEALNEFIKQNYPGVKVVETTSTSADIVNKCKTYNANLLILHGYLNGLENTNDFKKIIDDLTNIGLEKLRIIIYFGIHNEDVKIRADHVIKRGIYNYLYHAEDQSFPMVEFSAMIERDRTRADVLKDVIQITSYDEIELPSTTDAEQVQTVPLKQKVISIGGGSGSGKTSFVYNFSFYLSKLLKDNHITNINMLVIDLNLEASRLGYLFKTHKHPHTIFDLLPKLKSGTLSKDDFFQATTKPFKKHENLYLLMGNPLFDRACINFEERYLYELFQNSKKYFDIIIVNTKGTAFDTIYKTVYNCSNMHFYLIDSTLSNLFTTRHTLLHFYSDDTFRFDFENTHLIMNKFYKTKEFNMDEVTEDLRLSSKFTIRDYGQDFREALNKRTPFSAEKGSVADGYRQELRQLADLIYKSNNVEKSGFGNKIMNLFKR